MTGEELRALFTKYGDIIAVRVLTHPGYAASGHGRGVGFVRFDKVVETLHRSSRQRKEAEAALQELNGSVPPGFATPIQIKFADQRPRYVFFYFRPSLFSF
jgi:ELAV like protein 2/3/4